MYSLKLKESKVKDFSTRLTVGIEVDEKEIVERIKNFCKADDIIGVQPSTVFSLFDDFCEKNGLSKITSNSFGKIIKKLFGVERKKVRKGKDLFWVYAYKKQI